MSKTYNQVTLLGNLGKDPEIKTIPSGTKVATLNLATTESFKDKSGNWQETTDWHRVVLWDKKAEQCEKFLTKGSKVMIVGKLKTRSYEDQSGTNKYITEVIGRELVFLEKLEANQTSDHKENYNQIPEGDDDVPF